MQLIPLIATLFSILMPSKVWFAPSEPLNVTIAGEQAVTLVLSDFQGRRINTDIPTDVEPGKTIDVRAMFPAMRLGTYVLYAVPPGKTPADFVGTPLVIQLRSDTRPGAPSGAIVIKVEPLCVAQFDTTAGPMTAALYYDVAPNTVSNFISLVNGGFYDGLLFHRVLPDFVAQTGDPLGDSSGGPGYSIDAEFNGRLHLRGVMSMARENDPMESQGAMPRPEFANSAGSQFFFCLNYDKTKRLDRKYTAFGQVVAGEETLQKIGSGEIADTTTGRPKEPVKINTVRIVPVKAGEDPYPSLLEKTSEQK